MLGGLFASSHTFCAGMTAAAASPQTPSTPCSELDLQLRRLVAQGPLSQANSTATALLQCVAHGNEMQARRPEALLMSHAAEIWFLCGRESGEAENLLWRALGSGSRPARLGEGGITSPLLLALGSPNGDLKCAERMLARVAGARAPQQWFWGSGTKFGLCRTLDHCWR